MRRNKDIAVRLAAILGATGLHRLYLHGFPKGLGRLALVALLLWVEFYFFIGLFVLLGLIEAYRLEHMSQAAFDERYNRKKDRGREQKRPSPFRIPRASGKLRSGTAKFRNYDLPGALADFLEALREEPDNPAVHFNLACTYSLLEDSRAFAHLEKAVALGLEDRSVIRVHDALAWLRVQPEFEDFADRGYRSTVDALPPPGDGGLLAQLRRLEEERSSGTLREEDYRERREKLFRS